MAAAGKHDLAAGVGKDLQEQGQREGNKFNMKWYIAWKTLKIVSTNRRKANKKQ